MVYFVFFIIICILIYLTLRWLEKGFVTESLIAAIIALIIICNCISGCLGCSSGGKYDKKIEWVDEVHHR